MISPAQDALILVYVLLIALALWLGLVDFSLWQRHAETLTDFLRARPAWFYWPVGILAAGLFLVYVHLFVLPELP